MTPSQHGMLAASLGAARPGVYLQQIVATVDFELDVELFERCWQILLDRHAALRTSLHWDEAGQPRQQVWSGVRIQVSLEDVQHLEPTEQERHLARFLHADRGRSFDFERPPLMRLSCFRLAEAQFRWVWTFSHVLLDGRSHRRILEELVQLYEAFGNRRALPPVDRTFEEHVTWLGGRDHRPADDFWRQVIPRDVVPGVLPRLPHARGSDGSMGRVETRLSREQTAALQEFAAQHQLTINTLLQGAWALVTSRCTGQRQATFAVTHAGRRFAPHADSIVGVLINTLPLSIDVGPEEPLIAWLTRLRALHIALRPHEHTPLPLVRESLGLKPAEPLFESLVVCETQTDEPSGEEIGSLLSDLEIYERPEFPLALCGYAEPRLQLRLYFDDSEFSGEYAEQLLSHVANTLTAFVAAPDALLGDVPLLDESQRRQILRDFNDTAIELAADACLHELFANSAAATPEAVAIVCGEQRLTYRQLAERVERLAAQLAALEIREEEIVGVHAARTIDSLVAMLAILQAGGAYLPIDPAWPTERVAFVARDAGLRIILAAPDACDRYAGLAEHVWSSAAGDAARPEMAKHLLPASRRGRPDGLAYVIYTSGSTGQPKGVMIEHRAAVNTLLDINRRFEIGPQDRVLAVSSLTFDLSVYDVFGMWAVGGTVVLPSDNLARDPNHWAELIEAEQITVWDSVPALMQLLVNCHKDRTLPSLRVVLLSGDWIPLTLPPQTARLLPNARVISLGGATEASVWSNFHAIDAIEPAWNSVPYGKPLANQHLHVLDDRGQPCPIGVCGELYLGGAGVARGYLNRPELSRERFLADPFGLPHSQTLYRTGDLGRYWPDGTIEFLGRQDGQTKLHGYRIELGEIEAVLARYRGVQQAVAVVHRDDFGGTSLRAFVVVEDPASFDADEARRHAQGFLPEYMTPSQIVPLAEFPLSCNGKIDRGALLHMAVPAAVAASAAERPWSQSEELLGALWREFFHVDCVRLSDTFLQSGGDSLRAAELIVRVHRALGARVPLAMLLSPGSTVSDVAGCIESQLRSGAPLALPPPVPAASDGPAPLSYPQQQMWLVDQLVDGTPAYNVPVAFELQGTLDEDALRAALAAIVERHAVLRTRFITAADGQPCQSVGPAGNVHFRREDLRSLPLAGRDQRARQRLRDEACRTFDLSRDVLLRGLLLTVDEDRHLLLLTMHHIACDGASLPVLLHDLGELYAAFSTQRPSALAPVRLSCLDHAHWQRERWTPEILAPAIEYWRSKLSTPWPALDLPTDRPRPARQTFSGKTKRFLLDNELRSAVEGFSRRCAATPFMTLLAAFQTLLARYSGHEDLVIGVPVAGRHHPGLADLVGYFANVLAIRGDLSGAPTFRELLSRTRAATLEGFAYQDLPFEMLVGELGHVARPSAAPLFQVLFVMQPQRGTPLELFGMQATPLAIDTGTAKFDLALSLQPTADGWEAEIEYNTDLFDDARIDLLEVHLRTLLAAILDDPDRPLAELPLKAENEQRLLASWSAAEAAPALYPLLHAGFEAQAARRPQAVAARLEGETLSYEQLNARANQLAHWLIRRGLRCGDLVGICLPRSFDLLAALLGVMKAGGVCVPLDPAYPPQRLRLMLKESQAAQCLVADAAGRALLGDTAVALDRLQHELAEQPICNPTASDDPDRLAYVLFTSGSTGVPKGVAMSHAALTNLMGWQARHSIAGEATRTLQFASISFDVAFQELFATWWTGGELVLLPDQQHRDLTLVWRTICEARVERMFVPFVALQHLAALAIETPADCALREVITAGEQLRITPEIDRWLRKLPDCTLENQYGPTETHVATAFRMPRSIDAWTSLPPIGQPIGGVTAHVLDGQQRPQPIGVPGELYLGGRCLAQGYTHRPELTGQRFVTVSMDGHPTRLYRTGDLCRWRIDGQLEFLGRIDQQVKIRGYRVELGEVEHALLEHLDVVQCAAVACDADRVRRLLAFVVLRPGAAVGSMQLREHLQTQLPEYLVPAEIALVPSLPRLPNGKLDRRALVATAPQPAAPSKPVAAPRTSLESSLTRIWQEVLRRPSLGIDDDFFELGGDSLSAAIVFARIERDLRQRASLDLLLRASTVRQLASHFQHIRSPGEDASVLEIQAGGEGPPLFCIPGIGGHLVNFRSLSRQLSPELPMYGLKPQRIDRSQPQAVSEIAADYVERLVSLQPSGPYFLLGFSFGGLVAYEMAQQLLASGRTLGLVAIIDVAARWQPPASAIKRVGFHLRYLVQGRSANRWAYLKQRVLNVARSARLGPRGSPEDHVLNRLDLTPESRQIAQAHWQAYQQYAPAPLASRIVLFRSKWQPPTASAADPTLGWGRLAQGGIDVHELPGTHPELFAEPNLGLLAAALRTQLATMPPCTSMRITNTNTDTTTPTIGPAIAGDCR